MADILGYIDQQTSAAIVGSPVAEEQNIARQVLQQHFSNPAFDRTELQKLRKFLKQPLVGASVATLRQVLKAYSASSDPKSLVEAISELYEQQGQIDAASTVTRRVPRIAREDLRLVCYEYVCT